MEKNKIYLTDKIILSEPKSICDISVFKNNDLLVAANYPEKFGVKDNKDAGVQTTDIFYLKKEKDGRTA